MRHIISLGAGVQSSTMALMAAHGEIEPMPEVAIFADTGWEPRAVYEWLGQLKKWLPFPVVRVGEGNLRDQEIAARMRATVSTGRRNVFMPYYVDSDGEEGRVTRQCTAEYKIQPIEKYMRRTLLGLAPRQRAPREPVFSQWRGISADEAQRMKPSREPWFTVRYPLAMEHRMTRGDCLAWLARNGYPQAPRSACIGCPFHSDKEWVHLRDSSPAEWEDACVFDDLIRDVGGMRGKTYLHRSRVPLREAQIDLEGQFELWGEECEGMCGV